MLGTQKQLEEQSGEIKLLKERIANLSGEGQENQAGAEGAQLLGVSLWIWVSGGVAVVVGAIAATLWTAQRNDPQEEHEEAQVQESESDSD